MKHADCYTSYEYLKEHLYSKPQLYENSFRKLQSYLIIFRAFESLQHFLGFLAKPDQPNNLDAGQIRLRFRQELFRLDKAKPWLRPEITEMLMFVLWDDLVEKYGTGEGFSESYWDLMQEMQPQIAQIDTD